MVIFVVGRLRFTNPRPDLRDFGREGKTIYTSQPRPEITEITAGRRQARTEDENQGVQLQEELLSADVLRVFQEWQAVLGLRVHRVQKQGRRPGTEEAGSEESHPAGTRCVQLEPEVQGVPVQSEPMHKGVLRVLHGGAHLRQVLSMRVVQEPGAVQGPQGFRQLNHCRHCLIIYKASL